MLLPRAAALTAASAVKGGATTASQWRDCATSGRSSSTNSTASPMALYIFQLPAITGRRILTSLHTEPQHGHSPGGVGVAAATPTVNPSQGEDGWPWTSSVGCATATYGWPCRATSKG